MSIVSLDQGSNTPSPELDALLSKIVREPNIEEQLTEMEIIVAKEKGRDMVGHLIAFVEGKEDGFSRYFVTADPLHDAMHSGFWDEIRSNYPEMERQTFPDELTKRERHHIFADLSVMLRETAHIHSETGEEYDAMYVAERLPSVPKVVGKIATSQMMQ